MSNVGTLLTKFFTDSNYTFWQVVAGIFTLTDFKFDGKYQATPIPAPVPPPRWITNNVASEEWTSVKRFVELAMGMYTWPVRHLLDITNSSLNFPSSDLSDHEPGKTIRKPHYLIVITANKLLFRLL